MLDGLTLFTPALFFATKPKIHVATERLYLRVYQKPQVALILPLVHLKTSDPGNGILDEKSSGWTLGSAIRSRLSL
jgi:hypothetical protein